MSANFSLLRRRLPPTTSVSASESPSQNGKPSPRLRPSIYDTAILRAATACIFACCLANTLTLLYFLSRRPPFPLAPSKIAARHTYALVFSTGRSATRHLSALLTAAPSARAAIVHQDPSPSLSARDAMRTLYRPLLSAAGGSDRPGAGGEAAFNASAAALVRDATLPGLRRFMADARAARVVFTGHVPLVFGLGPALARAVPRGGLRVLRLRRERLAAAESLMALGPEGEDPWEEAAEGGVDRRRWFPGPTAPFVRLKVGEAVWGRLNRFQRWLWYVDDVECRWQAWKGEFGGVVEWREESLEGLAVLDGGEGWRRVADFLGVAVKEGKIGVRENSIKDKGREKVDVGEDQLREWDEEYRSLVGACDLAGDGTRAVSWQSSG